MTDSTPGFVLWLTGMSGAGKSTLSERLATEFGGRGVPVELLDGDEVREHLSKGLGFSREDRDTNVLRIGFVAKLLANHGVVAIVAAISPYREARARARAMAGRFVEVHVDCPLEDLEERDVKELYARARAGELERFTGISDPYEAPEQPEIRVNSSTQTIEESLGEILSWLEERSLVPKH